MKIRVIYNPDETIQTIYPAIKSKRDLETEEQWLNRVFSEATPSGVEYEDFDEEQLPKGDGLGRRGKKGIGVWIDEAEATKEREDQLISKEIERIQKIELRRQAKANLKAEGKIS